MRSLCHSHLNSFPRGKLLSYKWPIDSTKKQTKKQRKKEKNKERNHNHHHHQQNLQPHRKVLDFHSISSVPGPQVTCEGGQGGRVLHVGHGGLQGIRRRADHPHEAGVLQQLFLGGAICRHVAEQRYGVWSLVEQPAQQ